MVGHIHQPIHAGTSLLAAVDPRARLVAALAFTLVVTAMRGLPGMTAAVGAALVAVVLAGIPLGKLLSRLLPLEAVLLLLAIVLPWPSYDRERLVLVAAIALKAHAVLLAVMALVGTMEAVTLGHALAHLHVPRKLAQLLLFTIRYFDVLRREYARLRAAMRVRGFRPRMDRHTYRSLGYLAGMLLVRSFDRSERVLAAMRCRGFRGQFYLLDHFAFSARRDGLFCLTVAVLLSALVGMEWR